METPIKRPWWSNLRLSVTGLMVLVLAVGCWLGWLIRGARIQRDAVAALRGAGGRVPYQWELVDGRRNPNGAYPPLLATPLLNPIQLSV